MIRRLFSWLFLIAIVVGLWYGARWFRQSRALEATLIFDTPQAVQAGAPVMLDGERIGKVLRVSRLEKRQALVVSVDRERRNFVRTDSTFELDRSEGKPQLVVSSRFAIGRPVEDGAVIHVRRHKLASIMEKGASKVIPAAREWTDRTIEALKSYDSEKLESQFDDWTAQVPEWRRAGKESLDRNLEAISKKVDQAEAELRKSKRKADADRLRARFDRWLESFSTDEPEPPANDE